VLVSSCEFASLGELIHVMPQQTVLVFRTGCFYRSTLEHWFYQVGLVPNQVLELGTLDGILSCVAAGMGVTLLPKAVAQNYAARQAIALHALPREFANVKTVFIRRNDTLATPALSAFVALARDQLALSTDDTKAKRMNTPNRKSTRRSTAAA
jgi:DNA-binding transcriptional LysR family regulator